MGEQKARQRSRRQSAVAITAATVTAVLAVGACSGSAQSQGSNGSATQRAHIPIAELGHVQQVFNLRFKELAAKGVIVDYATVERDRFHITLDKHTAPGSDAIIRRTIGNVGLWITHNGTPAVADG